MSQDFKPIFDYLDDMKAELKAKITSGLGDKLDEILASINNLAYILESLKNN